MDMSVSASSSTFITPNTFHDLHTSLQTTVLKATRTSASLPSDISFYKSIDGGIAEDAQELENRVLEMLNRLVDFVDGDKPSKVRGKGKRKVEGVDDIVDNFHSVIVDSMDLLLERADICLDEFSGKLKRPPPVHFTTGKSSTATNIKNKQLAVQNATSARSKSKPYLDAALQHAPHIPKPQLIFKKKTDNSDAPWIPSLSHKYHAKVPLGCILRDEEAKKDRPTQDFDLDFQVEEKLVSSHPYYYEITHLSYPPHVFSPSPSPTAPPPLPSPPSLSTTSSIPSSYTYIDTLASFTSMLTKLRSPTVKELAIDLEHHSYRTYRGFLCLMQISTRTEDFIVDLLVDEIREKMEELGEVFADPGVVKVFHGAESDIVWLQQDFNLYIINLFDTFHASKLLEFPRHGLANLLEMYCDYIPDKRYQLADWRIRPLPQEMLQYAQSDTHFLLYIYDNLRNALLDRSRSRESSRAGSRTNSPPLTAPIPLISGDSSNSISVTTSHKTLLHNALQRSSLTALRVYTKEPYDSDYGGGVGGWDTLAKKWNKGGLTAANDLEEGVGDGGIHALQRIVYKSVHAWRERVSREEDESTRYVLPNHFLFQLAERPPADMAGLLGMFRSSVPPLVRKRAAELLEVVRAAVRKGLGKGKPKDIGMVEVEEIPKEASETAVEKAVENTTAVDMEDNKARVSNLWGQGNNSEVPNSSMSTPTSILFGSRLLSNHAPPPPNSSTSLSASQSALFGNTIKRISQLQTTIQSKNPVDSPNFKKIVAKINSTFVIAPSIPQLIAATGFSSATIATTATTAVLHSQPISSSDTQPPPESTIDPALGMQVEVPYVPASQRFGNLKMEDMGPIVVVGQPKQKKRKRAKVNNQQEPKETDTQTGDEDVENLNDAGGNDSASSNSKSQLETKSKTKKDKKGKRAEAPSKEGSIDDDAELTSSAYDFAAVPNILDHNPEDAEEQKRKKKRQKLKGGKSASGAFYGDFPAPPKAYSELKAGNRSYTFK